MPIQYVNQLLGCRQESQNPNKSVNGLPLRKSEYYVTGGRSTCGVIGHDSDQNSAVSREMHAFKAGPVLEFVTQYCARRRY